MLRITLLAALLLATACTSVPRASLQQLAAMDPMTADLSVLRIEAELPEALDVPPGGATLTISAMPDTGDPISHTAPFTRPAATTTTTRLGYHRLAFALSLQDAAALDAARKRIAALKAQGQKVPGSLSVSAAACVKGSLPDSPLLLSVWLDTGTGEPILIQKERDLRRLAARAGAASAVTACDP